MADVHDGPIDEQELMRRVLSRGMRGRGPGAIAPSSEIVKIVEEIVHCSRKFGAFPQTLEVLAGTIGASRSTDPGADDRYQHFLTRRPDIARRTFAPTVFSRLQHIARVLSSGEQASTDLGLAVLQGMLDLRGRFGQAIDRVREVAAARPGSLVAGVRVERAQFVLQPAIDALELGRGYRGSRGRKGRKKGEDTGALPPDEDAPLSEYRAVLPRSTPARMMRAALELGDLLPRLGVQNRGLTAEGADAMLRRGTALDSWSCAVYLQIARSLFDPWGEEVAAGLRFQPEQMVEELHQQSMLFNGFVAVWSIRRAARDGHRVVDAARRLGRRLVSGDVAWLLDSDLIGDDKKQALFEDFAACRVGDRDAEKKIQAHRKELRAH